ncbi:DUF2264 domain-containing protein [Brachybacterium endophyticum]|uniref:DUF2264 domain-containing protein n=1 Tax=Brachybacterium endophyticum TaxID=2182385 RepID=UPI0014036B32|nr:DUF2264 domain-containing protein [Brachybacterium endophyticum]
MRGSTVPGLPPPDPDLSPCTGLTRAHWEAVADHLLLALRPHASSNHALICPPGRPSRSGARSDGLEGFARSFLLAAGLIRARGDEDPHAHADRYARGLAAGVDPAAEDAWPRPSECAQAKVEACALAIGLDATRAQIWDRLDPAVRARLVDWFAEVIGTPYPETNWVWFRITVLTFLRSVDDRFVGGERSEEVLADLRRDLRVHESLVREGGWFADGPDRSFDHYADWVFSLLSALWGRMAGSSTLDRPGLLGPLDRERHRRRLGSYLPAALGLLGADGSPLIQGRSLVYRMASAGTFWAGAIAGVDADVAPPGLLRRAASGTLAHFLAHGVPDDDGLLTLGWFHRFEPMAQAYSGPGSPYWAAMGFAGLLLPPTHPVWTAPEEPLPVERGDGVSVLRAPGWIVSRTRADGIVRVLNHGTDHARQRSEGLDDPLYARLGYSTATSPQMLPGAATPAGPDGAVGDGEQASDGEMVCDGVVEPRDATVGLVDPVRGWSHRTGFETLVLRGEGAGTGEGGIGIAVSRQRCHWPSDDRGEPEDAGPAVAGAGREGPELLVGTLSHGPDTVLLVRSPGGTGGLPIGVAGWPLCGDRVDVEPDVVAAMGATASTRRADGSLLRSSLTILRGEGRVRARRAGQVAPLGPEYAVPEAMVDPPGPGPGGVVVLLMRLAGSPAGTDAPAPEVRRAGSGGFLVSWGGSEQAFLDLGDPAAQEEPTDPTASP